MDAEKSVILLLIFLLWNVRASAVMLAHLATIVLFSAFAADGVYYFCLVSAMFCVMALINIKVSKEICYVFFFLGCLNLAAAVDYYASVYQTVFYAAYPSIVRALDLILIAILLRDGGLKFAGISTAADYFNLRFNRGKRRPANMEGV